MVEVKDNTGELFHAKSQRKIQIRKETLRLCVRQKLILRQAR